MLGYLFYLFKLFVPFNMGIFFLGQGGKGEAVHVVVNMSDGATARWRDG